MTYILSISEFILRTSKTSPNLQYAMLLPFSEDKMRDLAKTLESDKQCKINQLHISSHGIAFVAYLTSEDPTPQTVEALIVQENSQVEL